jgi:hypothetical protein
LHRTVPRDDLATRIDEAVGRRIAREVTADQAWPPI